LEPESSSPYSQVPAICPYPEPTPSSLHPLPLPEDRVERTANNIGTEKAYVVPLVEASRNVVAHAQKADFFFRRNGRVHLNRRGRQFSRLLVAEVCASAFIVSRLQLKCDGTRRCTGGAVKGKLANEVGSQYP